MPRQDRIGLAPVIGFALPGSGNLPDPKTPAATRPGLPQPKIPLTRR